MDDTTKILMQIVQDIAELKTDMKNIKDKLEGTETKCDDCQPARKIKEHIEDHKETKRWRWEYFIFSFGAIYTVVELGQKLLSLLSKK